MSQLTNTTERAAGDLAEAAAESAAESEIVCTLSEERQAERREELRNGIVKRIRRVRELADGYAFGLDLSPADEAEVDAFIAFESQCCGFASYAVQRDEANSIIWLSVRGPAGSKDFVRQLAPDSIAIEALTADGTEPGEERDHDRDGKLMRTGIAGAGAALVAIVCCATPILGVALGSIGLAAAVASVSLWVDVVVAPLLLASLLLIGIAAWRRRAAKQANSPMSAPASSQAS